ncbi:c-type cytochrome [Oscillochloris sp. ZM17-4]|uniref:cytochrome-c peroxidase n=1 Tax=Oscillochloris sp. ZM17-4 TaxID=2866714 RepID=UPI001C737051|nr:cytochrome c peroxidase [Oscillochloris sp. ZM17-4]MBX0328511.1 c-type cytochrome [Oscillochloris sp. ZM17-4]
MRRALLLGLICLGAAWLLGHAAAPPPPDTARVALGWRLLADRRLSVGRNFSCLDCHRPGQGYADGKPVATADGINTPTLYGLAERTTFGWFTPEVPSLEAFILRPLDNPREMGPLAEATLDRLRADPEARAAYAAAFPGAGQGITWERTAQALAAAIRTIPSPPTGALTPAAARGQTLFAEVGCGGCHQGATLSSEAYLNTGVSADLSRNGGKARVPSLIGLSQTAPYFHDGSAATLEEVVRFYQRGGNAPGPGVSRGVSPIVITDAELRDLVSYLSSL